ncbi:hypothetical protein [Kitasatospora sp. NPDC004531]
MPICPSCGAAVAGAVATCANCGRPLGAPPSAIGEVVADDTAGPSPWGAGRVHQDRQWPTPSRGWLTAGRVLLAPTALLVVLAVLGSTVGGRDVGGVQDDPAVNWTTHTFQMWLQLTLTAFGAPWRSTSTSTYGTATATIHVLPYAVALGWLALLWLGQRLAARARAAAGAAEPTGLAAGAQALRTGALSAAAALVLGWISSGSSHKDLEALELSTDVTTGPAMVPLGVSAFLAAAAVVLAVDGQGALRAEAARRRLLGGWLLAWQHAARVVGGLLALLTVVSVVMQVVADRPFALSDFRALAVNNGVQLFGIGTGARGRLDLLTGTRQDSFALYDLGGHGGQWWLAVLPVLLAALALGWSAHRGRLTQLDRARLAVLYAALTAALVLGTSTWLSDHSAIKGEVHDGRTDVVGWSLATVLPAAAAWAVFGALLVPAVLDAVRRTPVPLSAPLPAQATGEPEGASGLVELVVEEHRPTVGRIDVLDSHAAYRRPDAG